MNGWQRWLQAPHTHWLRRALFQIHLWSGIGLGVYVLVISISGSAILLQSPIIRFFAPGTIDPVDFTSAEALTGQDLQDRMIEVYSDYEVYFTVPGFTPERATYVVLNQDGGVFPHYFNQFTGEDIGPSNPAPVRAAEWLVDIHDDLFMGRDGRRLNGLGGIVFLIMFLSGMTIWWQGRSRWKESLMIRRNSLRSFNWQLHSVVGFWSLLLMFAWGLTGFYLGFTREFNSVLNWFGSDFTGFERPGWLRFLLDVHFARYGSQSAWARWTWIIASFMPSLMVITGFIIWWKRVILKKRPS